MDRAEADERSLKSAGWAGGRMQLLRVNRLVVAAGRVTVGLRVEEQEDERKVSTALLTSYEGAEVLKSAEDNVDELF